MAVARTFHIRPRQVLQHGIHRIITIKHKMRRQLNFSAVQDPTRKDISQCIIRHRMFFISRVQTGRVTTTMEFRRKLAHFYRRQLLAHSTMASEVLAVSWASIKRHRITTWMWIIMANISTMDCRVCRRHRIQCQLAVIRAVLEFPTVQIRQVRWARHVQRPSRVHTSGWRNHLIRVSPFQVISIIFYIYSYLPKISSFFDIDDHRPPFAVESHWIYLNIIRWIIITKITKKSKHIKFPVFVVSPNNLKSRKRLEKQHEIENEEKKILQSQSIWMDTYKICDLFISSCFFLRAAPGWLIYGREEKNLTLWWIVKWPSLLLTFINSARGFSSRPDKYLYFGFQSTTLACFPMKQKFLLPFSFPPTHYFS